MVEEVEGIAPGEIDDIARLQVRDRSGGPPPPRPHSRVDSIRKDEDTSGFEGTLAGTLMGTPDYMSPEQSLGQVEAMDGRADLYSLGVILYEILTLHKPIRAHSLDELLEKKRRGETDSVEKHSGKLPHCRRGVAPASLAAVTKKAMALDPANRYPDVPAFQEDIEAWQGGFATAAEDADWLQQFWLLMKRKRGVVLSILIILSSLLIGLSVALNSLHQKNQEEKKPEVRLLLLRHVHV